MQTYSCFLESTGLCAGHLPSQASALCVWSVHWPWCSCPCPAVVVVLGISAFLRLWPESWIPYVPRSCQPIFLSLMCLLLCSCCFALLRTRYLLLSTSLMLPAPPPLSPPSAPALPLPSLLYHLLFSLSPSLFMVVREYFFVLL